MTSEQFKAWRKAMGFSQVKAADALGLSKSAVEQYDQGRRKGTGEPVEISRVVALACSALFHRLEEWRS